MDHVGLEGHDQQHQPRGGDGQSGAVDGPGLPRLHLRTGAGVVAQVARQVAQQPAELAAADLTSDPETLDHAVADRVGQLVLQPVETLAETAGHLVVEGESVERRPQRLRPAHGQRGQRVGQRHARAYR
jgi:hypothetical protein